MSKPLLSTSSLSQHKNSQYATFTIDSPPKAAPPSLLSRVLLTFAMPVMRVGNERQLQQDDLWELFGENAPTTAYHTYKRHLNDHNGSVIRAGVSAYGGMLLLCGLGSLFNVACSIFAPVVMHHVIDVFAASVIDLHDLGIWLSVFFASRLLNAFVSVNTAFNLEMIAIRWTVSLKTLLFQKTMRRNVASKHQSKTVDISNLFTSDVSRLLSAAYQVNDLWILPIQIGVTVYFLYFVIDLAAFAGLAVICLSLVASFWISKFSGKAMEELTSREDERIKLIKEVFGAIQIVKLNAWESKFTDKINAIREAELRALARFVYTASCSIFVLWASPLLVSMVSFATYTLVLGKPLTAAKVFTAIALFNSLRDPLRSLPSVLQRCIQSKVSLDRISAFLAMEEYDTSNVAHEEPSLPRDIAVSIKNGSFSWIEESAVLQNVNVDVKQGDLVVVSGPVGSGKSSLCSALLGEMIKLTGQVCVRGQVAYYSQQTWIQNRTIRENVLFGLAYEERKYRNVLDACGLLPDLEQFPAGDMTEIGQKGVNLSGGQKARVGLARACYSDADVFILDSPLAAVDAVVQSEIFSKCFCGLLAHKTVILVTHSPDIIASGAANHKIRIDNGVVIGSRNEPEKPRHTYATNVSPRKLKQAIELESENATAKRKDLGRLVEVEERKEGRVSKNIYWGYINSLGGTPVILALFLIQSTWQACQIGSDLWLSHWTGQKSTEFNQEKIEYNMKVYASLLGVCGLMVFARAFGVSFASLRGSRHLFDGMTRSLLNAPLRFFDANPIGRIINRYGDDMSTVDTDLGFVCGGLSANIFVTVCQLAMAVYAVKFLGFLILPLVYIYFKIGAFYLAPSREIERLWKVSSSPVLSYINQSEEGLVTIRAFGPGCVSRTIQENFGHIYQSTKAQFAVTVAVQWFELQIKLLSCGIVIVVVSSLVYLHDYLSPGMVGLAFTYALSIDRGLGNVVDYVSYLEVCMVSPERIMEYSEIPPEGNRSALLLEPAHDWPRQGTIQFKNVVFSYKPDAPPVLKGLSFDIKNNEKIGIVGRTGAGKSSLTMALFRINELVSGRIVIDGQDIATMPLHSLRSKLAIIPQAPVLFKGPLRAYMDPFDEFTDTEIWSVFDKVDMKEQVAALENQLSYELSENGENFSVGERQMLCMARALLTQTRIVVMDEATASIDHATEKKLQEMIDRDFQDATVLTIAHRLATVLDSDRVMVLSDGCVVEFDAPKELVKNPEGAFYQLAKEGGYLEKLL